MEQMASASSSVFFFTCSSCAAWISGSRVSLAPHTMRPLSLSHSSCWLTLQWRKRQVFASQKETVSKSSPRFCGEEEESPVSRGRRTPAERLLSISPRIRFLTSLSSSSFLYSSIPWKSFSLRGMLTGWMGSSTVRPGDV
ncbi:hypothetical protein EYF80_052045 [Liparis tanakae]|uniref:Uncharacterized protein n=1 Tax=Liparis tanakae TaxID=230148 RepID=A0A4Z2F992_9TELE|nr:hypothetical protein EYF80_052045 [Liparis tanakae]